MEEAAAPTRLARRGTLKRLGTAALGTASLTQQVAAASASHASVRHPVALSVELPGDAASEDNTIDLSEVPAEWASRLENLLQRFPESPSASVLAALKKNDGMAGRAARDLAWSGAADAARSDPRSSAPPPPRGAKAEPKAEPAPPSSASSASSSRASSRKRVLVKREKSGRSTAADTFIDVAKGRLRLAVPAELAGVDGSTALGTVVEAATGLARAGDRIVETSDSGVLVLQRASAALVATVMKLPYRLVKELGASLPLVRARLEVVASAGARGAARLGLSAAAHGELLATVRGFSPLEGGSQLLTGDVVVEIGGEPLGEASVDERIDAAALLATEAAALTGAAASLELTLVRTAPSAPPLPVLQVAAMRPLARSATVTLSQAAAAAEEPQPDRAETGGRYRARVDRRSTDDCSSAVYVHSEAQVQAEARAKAKAEAEARAKAEAEARLPEPFPKATRDPPSLKVGNLTMDLRTRCHALGGHLPPIDTATAAEFASALLRCAGSRHDQGSSLEELWRDFGSMRGGSGMGSAAEMGLAGECLSRSEIEDLIVLLVDAKPLLPRVQAAAHVHEFVGHIFSDDDVVGRGVLRWEGFEASLVGIAAGRARVSHLSALPDQAVYIRERMAAVNAAAAREAHSRRLLSLHQRMAGVNTGDGHDEGSIHANPGLPHEHPKEQKPCWPGENADVGKSVGLAAPSYSDMVEYLLSLGAERNDLSQAPRTMTTMATFAQLHGGDIKDTDAVRAANEASRSTSRERMSRRSKDPAERVKASHETRHRLRSTAPLSTQTSRPAVTKSRSVSFEDETAADSGAGVGASPAPQSPRRRWARDGLHSLEHGLKGLEHGVEHGLKGLAHAVEHGVEGLAHPHTPSRHTIEHGLRGFEHAVEHGLKGLAHGVEHGAHAVEHGVEGAVHAAGHVASAAAVEVEEDVAKVRDSELQAMHAVNSAGHRIASQLGVVSKLAVKPIVEPLARHSEALHRHSEAWWDHRMQEAGSMLRSPKRWLSHDRPALDSVTEDNKYSNDLADDEGEATGDEDSIPDARPVSLYARAVSRDRRRNFSTSRRANSALNTYIRPGDPTAPRVWDFRAPRRRSRAPSALDSMPPGPTAAEMRAADLAARPSTPSKPSLAAAGEMGGRGWFNLGRRTTRALAATQAWGIGPELSSMAQELQRENSSRGVGNAFHMLSAPPSPPSEPQPGAPARSLTGSSRADAAEGGKAGASSSSSTAAETPGDKASGKGGYGGLSSLIWSSKRPSRKYLSFAGVAKVREEAAERIDHVGTVQSGIKAESLPHMIAELDPTAPGGADWVSEQLQEETRISRNILFNARRLGTARMTDNQKLGARVSRFWSKASGLDELSADLGDDLVVEDTRDRFNKFTRSTIATKDPMLGNASSSSSGPTRLPPHARNLVYTPRHSALFTTDGEVPWWWGVDLDSNEVLSAVQGRYMSEDDAVEYLASRLDGKTRDAMEAATRKGRRRRLETLELRQLYEKDFQAQGGKEGAAGDEVVFEDAAEEAVAASKLEHRCLDVLVDMAEEDGDVAAETICRNWQHEGGKGH